MPTNNKLDIDTLFKDIPYADVIDLINRTYDINQIDEKIEVYNYIINKYKNENELHISHYNRGTLYLENEDYLKAITDFSSALKQENTDYRYHFQRSKAYTRIGDYDHALDDCENAIYWFSESEKSNNLKGLDKELNSLEKVDLLNLKVSLYLAKNEYNKAKKTIADSMKISETAKAAAASAKAKAVKALHRPSPFLGNPDGLNKILNIKILDISNVVLKIAVEKIADTYSLSGDCNMQMLSYNNAILDYNSAIDNNPENPVYYHSRGNAYMQLNKHDEAIDDFSKAIELSPAYEYYFSRACAYFKKNDIINAINDFNKVIELNDTYKDAYIYRSKCYGMQKEYIKAITDLSTAISLSTTDLSSEDINNLDFGDINNLILRANLYSCMCDFGNAVSDLSKAIECAKLYEMSSLLNQPKNMITKVLYMATGDDTNTYDNELSKLVKLVLKQPKIIGIIDATKTADEVKKLIDETDASKLIKLIDESDEPNEIIGFLFNDSEIKQFLEKNKNRVPTAIQNMKDVLYCARAKAYIELKEPEMAQKDIEKIRNKMDGDILNAKLHNLNTWFYSVIGQVQSLSKNITDSYLYQEIGNAQFRGGNKLNALHYYGEAIKSDQNNKSAYALKGEVYSALRKAHSSDMEVKQALEDWDKQIDCYKTFLSMNPDPSEYPDGYSRLDYAFAIKDYIENRLNHSIENAKADEELKKLTDKLEELNKLILSDTNDNISNKNPELIEEFLNDETLFETQIEETSAEETLIEAPTAPIAEDTSIEGSSNEVSKVNVSFNEFVQDIKTEKNNTTAVPSNNETEAAAKNPEK